MSTIVEYTEAAAPQNLFPNRIISPPRSGPCCFTNTEALGTPQADGRWIYQYKRCCRCGFAVRVILKVLPDEEAINILRTTLEGFSGR